MHERMKAAVTLTQPVLVFLAVPLQMTTPSAYRAAVWSWNDQ